MILGNLSNTARIRQVATAVTEKLDETVEQILSSSESQLFLNNRIKKVASK